MDLVLERAVWGGGGDQKLSGVVSGAGGANDGDGDEGGEGSIGPEDGEGHVCTSSSIAGSGIVAYRDRVWNGGDERLVVRVFDVANKCL